MQKIGGVGVLNRKKGRRKVDAGNVVVAILFMIILYPLSWIAVSLWELFTRTAKGLDPYTDGETALYALVLAVVVDMVVFLSEHFKSDKKKEIDAKFQKDKTSICPHCGSENIKVYPKGYNYKFAFWGELAGSRSAPFVAGLDSNAACCRCKACGKKWKTSYDYQELDIS